MSLITDELVRAVRTATLCRRSASAKRAENVLSSYRFCRIAVRAMPRVFVCVACPGRSDRPARIPGIVTMTVNCNILWHDIDKRPTSSMTINWTLGPWDCTQGDAGRGKPWNCRRAAMPRHRDQQVQTGCCRGQYGAMVGALHNPVHHVGGKMTQLKTMQCQTYASPPHVEVG
jgi:hypothetical protein